MDDRGIFADAFLFRTVSYSHPAYDGPTFTELAPGRRIAILEFDDQGLCFKRSAMGDLQAELDRLKTDLDGGQAQPNDSSPVIIVFAHGWKHNAGDQDDNLAQFKTLLKTVPVARPVLGVYLAWRGLSRAGNFIWLNSSFWDRKDAATRVASGSARELLGRLKAFRNGPDPRQPRATLIVVGHSFGALVVYTALAQSLIEAATTSALPSFGDLVLLVNPAFSAISYLPIYELLQRSASGPGSGEQFPFPVFVSVTATNDDATRLAYPAGTWSSLFTEAWRGWKEREALFRTMGHLWWLRTHELSVSDKPANAASTATGGRAAFQSLSGATETNRAPRPHTFGHVTVTQIATGSEKPNPFWVASATPAIIDGHNGIFKPVFIEFVQKLVTATAEGPPTGSPPPAP